MIICLRPLVTVAYQSLHSLGLPNQRRNINVRLVFLFVRKTTRPSQMVEQRFRLDWRHEGFVWLTDWSWCEILVVNQVFAGDWHHEGGLGVRNLELWVVAVGLAWWDNSKPIRTWPFCDVFVINPISPLLFFKTCKFIVTVQLIGKRRLLLLN